MSFARASVVRNRLGDRMLLRELFEHFLVGRGTGLPPFQNRQGQLGVEHLRQLSIGSHVELVPRQPVNLGELFVALGVDRRADGRQNAGVELQARALHPSENGDQG